MHYKLLPHLWYTISSAADCDVDCSNGISIHLPANFQHFLFADMESIDISGEATVTQNPPNFTPYSESRGEEWTADLRIGHAAAEAVQAVCTLTLGDLATGGTLTDSNGQSVVLENPHKYAEGWVAMPDATAAGTIAFGEHEAIEFANKAAAKAAGYFYIHDGDEDSKKGGTLTIKRGGEVVFSHEFAESETVRTCADFKAEIEALEDWVFEITSAQGYEIDFYAPETGEAWNDAIVVVDGQLLQNQGWDPEYSFRGGQNARTPQEVLDALNASEDCPAIATLDADEGGISFTAKEYGVNDTIVVTGSLFSNAIGMRDGHGDYTVAELVTAISGEFSDITPAAGEAEGTITLTATTAGKAANAITYTATGCFGSGTTRQGSTTRGKDAVEQTDYKIYLNGEEFSGGGAPAAPVPEPLGTTTTLLHGHVYTLAVAENTDLSALGVELNATAELWVDYTAGSVTWPTLYWLDGTSSDAQHDHDVPPDMSAVGRHRVTLRNEGSGVTYANVAYSSAIPTTPAQS